jgi:hypothetical protein
MTVGELIDALQEMPRDDEAFIRTMDTQRIPQPIYELIAEVIVDPEGIMICAGEEVEFTDAAEQS